MSPPNRFCAREHDDYLAAVTVHLLREREHRYPAAIEAGRLAPDVAARKLELMRCIVAQWRWIADRARPIAPAEDPAGRLFGAHNFELVEELDGIVTAQRTRAAKNGDDEWHATFLLLVEALAWSQRDRQGRAGSCHLVDWLTLDRAELHRTREQRRAA